MKINVKFFALGKELIGVSEIEMEFPETLTVQTLIERLKQDYEKFKELSSFRVAVNMEFSDVSAVLKDGDEVAIIPPVSGG